MTKPKLETGDRVLDGRESVTNLELDWVAESTERFHSVMEENERRFYQIEAVGPQRWKLYLMVRCPAWTQKFLYECNSARRCKEVASEVHAAWLAGYIPREERLKTLVGRDVRLLREVTTRVHTFRPGSTLKIQMTWRGRFELRDAEGRGAKQVPRSAFELLPKERA